MVNTSKELSFWVLKSCVKIIGTEWEDMVCCGDLVVFGQTTIKLRLEFGHDTMNGVHIDITGEMSSTSFDALAQSWYPISVLAQY